MDHPPLTVVVAAAVLGPDGDLLVARRTRPLLLAGRWEFPGGKVEPGETDQVALRRELREELGIEVVIGSVIAGPHGADWPIGPGRVIRVYACTLAGGEPQPLAEHDELRWLAPSEWLSVDWLDADVPIVAELRKHV